MRYVIDASVAVKWVLPESDSEYAINIRNQIATGMVQIVAPDTFPIEVAHALTRAERRGTIPFGEAIDRLNDVLENEPELFPTIELLSRAVEMSSQKRIGVYDCLYVALAEELGCELITADVRLVKSFPEMSRIILSSNR